MMNSDEIERGIGIAFALACRFEGLFLRPYICPAGVPTIGRGATFYEDGRKVSLADPVITRARADALLMWMIRTIYAPAVLRLCPNVDTAERLAALIDFALNCGVGNLKASTMRKRVLADRWDEARQECMKWCRAAGRVLRGLELRRAAEAALM